MKINKAIGLSVATGFVLAAIGTVVMQSFVIGTTRYTPADKPEPFWAVVALLAALAAGVYYLTLRGRKKIG